MTQPNHTDILQNAKNALVQALEGFDRAKVTFVKTSSGLGFRVSIPVEQDVQMEVVVKAKGK